MKVVYTKSELQHDLAQLRSDGKTIGLVPTMGALHRGHASLVEQSVANNAVTVVSVFVNPTQFNDKNDLLKYPRTLDVDCKLLDSLGVTFVFAPSVEEMYPQPDTRSFSFTPLDEVMEGLARPGHFNGVAQVVSKLFDIVAPTRAYFGEKDFQQLAIIKEMVKQLHYDLEIVGCPIIREADGLAMSSRNARLSSKQRNDALQISKILFESVNYSKNHSVLETEQYVCSAIGLANGLELDYFQIVDAQSLQQVTEWEQASAIIGCITVYCGEVRLIDNIKYKSLKLN
ncbi:MAG: pantoate--beta-alanine ligase [Bacteroidaceae bacterium]